MSRQVRKEWILDLSNPWAKPLIIGLGVGATIYLAIRLTRWLKTNVKQKLFRASMIIILKS